MRVLVIGGTRFIGPAAVERLVARGAEVTILHRGSTEIVLPEEVVHIHDDRANLTEHVRSVMPDVLLDMVPIHSDHGDQVVVAAVAGDVSRVVAVTSMDVYRAFDVVHRRDDDVQPVPFDEEAEVRRIRYPYADRFPEDSPMHRYDKLDVEDRVLGRSEFVGVSLRLPAVFGPGDFQHRVGEYLYRMADGVPSIVLSDRAAGWRFMRSYRDDVGDAIALACIHPEASGIYNVGTSDWDERRWVEAVAAVYGWDGKVEVIPDEDLPEEERFGGEHRQDLVADTTRMRSLGWSEHVGMEKGIDRTIPWELENRPEV